MALGKIKKFDKPLVRLIKKKRVPKSIKSEMKKKLQLTVQKYKGSQEITMNNYRPIKWTKKKMDKFLEMYNLPTLNQEETKTYEQTNYQ